MHNIGYSLLDDLAKRIDADESAPRIPNVVRIKQIKENYESVARLCGIDANVKLNMHKPVGSMGYISVCGKQLTITDTGEFVDLCKSADNIDIFPRTDGVFEMDMTYHGLTNKVK